MRKFVNERQKRTLRQIGLAICLAVGSLLVQAQDINFSQFYELPLLRNPALAGGYKGDARLTTAYRNQWASVTTPYRTMAAGLEARLPIGTGDDYISVGCQTTHDVAGDSRLSKTQVLPLLTYHKSLNSEKDAYLSAGFLAGGAQQRFDPSGLKFSDQFVGGSYRAGNPTQQTFTATQVMYWDAAAGLSYSSVVGEDTRFYVGAALFHFTQPKVAFNAANDFRLNKKYVVNAGVSGALPNSARIIFYADFFAQGGAGQMQAGAMYQQTIADDAETAMQLLGGCFYRWNDALMPVVKFNHNNLSAGLSYDVNISKLLPASQARGGAELTLSYHWFFKDHSSTARSRCPVSVQ